jgi:hypothetical protein
MGREIITQRDINNGGSKNGIRNLKSITIKASNIVEIRNPTVIELCDALLCVNCDKIHNREHGCPGCGSKNFVSLFNHFKGYAGKYNEFENNPGVKEKKDTIKED